MKVKIQEDKITHLATFPHDFKQYKTMLEDKDREVASMKKKIRILDAHIVQTNELVKAEEDNQEIKKNLHDAPMKNK